MLLLSFYPLYCFVLITNIEPLRKDSTAILADLGTGLSRAFCCCCCELCCLFVCLFVEFPYSKTTLLRLVLLSKKCFGSFLLLKTLSQLPFPGQNLITVSLRMITLKSHGNLSPANYQCCQQILSPSHNICHPVVGHLVSISSLNN